MRLTGGSAGEAVGCDAWVRRPVAWALEWALDTRVCS
jgi:hypothetical protein